jgi:hypothetical protein
MDMDHSRCEGVLALMVRLEAGKTPHFCMLEGAADHAKPTDGMVGGLP